MDQDSHANDAFLRSQEDNDSADDMTLPPSYEEATSHYANEEITATTSAGATTTTTRGHGRSQSQSYSHYAGDTSGPSRSSDYNLNDDIQGSSDDDDDQPNQVPSARSTQTFIQPRSGHNVHSRHGSSGHHGHGHGHGHGYNHGHNHHGHHTHPAHFPGGQSHAPLAPNLEPTITPSAPPLSTAASSSQPSSQSSDTSSILRGPPTNRPFMPFSGGVTPPYFPGFFPDGMSMPPMPHMPHMPPMHPMPPGSYGGGRSGFGFPGGFPHFAGFGQGPSPGPMGFMPRPPLPPSPPPPPPPSSSSSYQFDSPTAPKDFNFAKPGPSTSTSKEGSQGLSSSTSGTSEQTIPPRPSSPSNSSGGGLPPQSVSTAGLMSAQDISTAEFSTSKKGVESKDPILDDPFQLYRFFVAHNDRPSMHVLITGHHMEQLKVEDLNEDGTTKTVTSKVRVQDFKMCFDLTSYISPSGTLTTLPNPKTGRSPTLREVMEAHVEEDNPFKELHMEKRIQWDFEHLTRMITNAIRSVNYRYTIEISYPVTNSQVVVQSASPLANFMRSTWTKAFCYMSCVGFVFYPLRNFYKKVDDTSLRSEFQMTISTIEFYRNNFWNIIEQVQFKTK
ncbi:hypothetical protein BGZ52_002496 [Haplosporangium bisporale]|nr:hypothetical protein BGZ52_002496 [Haplosporangium bisporale]